MTKKSKVSARTERTEPQSENTLIVYGPEAFVVTRSPNRTYGVVDLDKLEQNVQEFVNKIGGIVTRLPKEVGAFELDSIELSAEVSAKGSLSFLGTGGEVEGRGGIKFAFKRPEGQKRK